MRRNGPLNRGILYQKAKRICENCLILLQRDTIRSETSHQIPTIIKEKFLQIDQWLRFFSQNALKRQKNFFKLRQLFLENEHNWMHFNMRQTVDLVDSQSLIIH